MCFVCLMCWLLFVASCVLCGACCVTLVAVWCCLLGDACSVLLVAR